jgi:uncharacterized protein (DUF2252 family)
MTRVYSDIRKLKKVEALIRENAVGLERIADEIDRAKTGRHTKAELEALTVARAQCLAQAEDPQCYRVRVRA